MLPTKVSPHPWGQIDSKWRDERDILYSRNQKRAWLPIFIAYKADLKSKMVTRNRDDHYIMIRGSIHQEDIKS